MACILIVEDNDNVRLLLALLLRHFGHEVSEAGDGATGVGLFRIQPFDLVFTDMVMPGMHGLEVIGEIRRLSPRTGIVAMSGDNLAVDGSGGELAAGLTADRVLGKPFSTETLRDVLADLLGRTRGRAESACERIRG